VPDDHNVLINPTRLLFELQKIARLNRSLSGCLKAEAIAVKITDGLVAQFNCAFTRIWLVKTDRTALKLVASSGLYTRLDGDFATVPMGAYKVGKIAQHCIPFLSNQLAQESWVKDRQWAIDNQICGFAGLPLAIQGQSIGVLAVFNHQPMAAEFLEALRILCSSLSVALNNAQLDYQQAQTKLHHHNLPLFSDLPLSEQISRILPHVRLILVGTEVPLKTSLQYLLLRTAEVLKMSDCSYCRLTYDSDRLYLSAMLVLDLNLDAEVMFQDINLVVNSLDGTLHSDLADNQIIQLNLSLPYQTQPKIPVNLSEREQEVIKFLAAGMRDREIAQKLFISDRTVKFHIHNAVTKLHARTRIQAIYQAYSQGYLS
jgi:DNA-binding CsgD family transcriptional regulator